MWSHAVAIFFVFGQLNWVTLDYLLWQVLCYVMFVMWPASRFSVLVSVSTWGCRPDFEAVRLSIGRPSISRHAILNTLLQTMPCGNCGRWTKSSFFFIQLIPSSNWSVLLLDGRVWLLTRTLAADKTIFILESNRSVWFPNWLIALYNENDASFKTCCLTRRLDCFETSCFRSIERWFLMAFQYCS